MNTVSISCQEVIAGGKSVVYYKNLNEQKKALLPPVGNFERAVEIKRILMQALGWQMWSFRIEKRTESWDSQYYALNLNGEFLYSDKSQRFLFTLVDNIVKRLGVKKHVLN